MRLTKGICIVAAATCVAVLLAGCRQSAEADGGRMSDMRLIRAGTFQMGSNDTNASSDEKPVHSVTLTKSFYLCDHEVTQAEWKAVFGNNPSRFDGSSGKEAADGEAQDERPVERVNWYMAIAYCNKLSLKEGLEPCYSVSSVSDWESLAYGDIPTSSDEAWNAATCDFAKTGYRLPTEAEWEYAARGGIATTTERAWAGTTSETELGDYAWYDGNSESKTHEVKKKKPNGYGLYDMSGNVWEWCWDWLPASSDYADDKDGATDPAGPSSGSGRVLRGGSWNNYARVCAVSFRGSGSPEDLNGFLGFRVVRSAN